MYGIPQGLDLTMIIGSDLNLLGQGRYDVQFHFNGKAAICVQSPVQVFQKESCIATWDEDENWSSLGFQKLLNQTVTGYSILSAKLMEIYFTNNLSLRLSDDSDQYECILIYFPESTLREVII